MFGAYPSGNVIDPSGASAGSDRVFRGGHFQDDNVDMMLEGRISGDPSLKLEKIGFRVVRRQ